MSSSSPFKVLVAGGSYGGISAALNLLDLCSGQPARCTPPDQAPREVAPKSAAVEVQIVDERDGYLHLLGCPLAFASNEHASKMWVNYENIPALQHPAIKWTQGTVSKVEPERRVATVKESRTGELVEQSYDYFIAATGLRRKFPVAPQGLSRAQFLDEAAGHVKSVKAADAGIAVIGGGAVGIEMAAELKITEPSKKVTLIHSRDKLLSAEPLPDEFRDETLKALQEIGVEVVLGRGRVVESQTTPAGSDKMVQRLSFPDGTHIDAAHVINAVSTPVPTTSYLPRSTLSEEGLVKINSLLRFAGEDGNDPRHLAVGDIAKWSGIKRCGGAIHMGQLAADGIHQQIVHELHGIEPKLTPLPEEVPPMMALAIGKKAATYSPETGVACNEAMMQHFFQDDLAFDGCWNIMKLSEPPASKPISE